MAMMWSKLDATLAEVRPCCTMRWRWMTIGGKDITEWFLCRCWYWAKSNQECKRARLKWLMHGEHWIWSRSPKITDFGYDVRVVYTDIEGSNGAHGLLESLALLDTSGKALEPRCIVIKSLCMNRLASQLNAFSVVWHKINAHADEGL